MHVSVFVCACVDICAARSALRVSLSLYLSSLAHAYASRIRVLSASAYVKVVRGYPLCMLMCICLVCV